MSNTEKDEKKSSAVCVKCLASPGAVLPSYESEGAAGADVRAFLGEPLCIKSGDYAAVPTGLCFEIPEGYEIQVRPRSGLAAKKGVTVLNAPGTIDSDYRGEVKVILINHGKEDFTVSNGDRIAQLIVSPVLRAEFATAQELSSTRRGAGGFGSTGV